MIVSSTARAVIVRMLKSSVRVTFRVIWFWAVLLVIFYDPWPVWARSPVALIMLVSPLVARRRRPGLKAVTAVACIVLALFLRSIQQPTNDRKWISEQIRLATAEFDGDLVHIRNLRHMSFNASGEKVVEWYDRTYDLAGIQSIDFVVAGFSPWRGLAHTFVTFGFDDGEYVVISVESRKERHEAYSAFRGLFRSYEITYNMGDERDFIGNRSHVHGFKVYLFPIKVTSGQARAVFMSYLGRANELAVRPEFYNTLKQNCTTSIVRHMEDVSGEKVPFDLRVVFPGYSDNLAYEMGLIDAECLDSETREAFRVNTEAPLSLAGREWSRRIRPSAVLD